MRLRPRQQTFVERCVAALDEHGNTAGIAPTGAGKTVMLSAVTGKYLHRGISRALILQHRDELLGQNASKFIKVVPDGRPSIFNAERKDWRGDVVFASEPTLRRPENLDRMPPFDLAIIDECHHVAADGYQGIVGALRLANPKLKLFGVTATPNRGDRKALEPTFTNIGDQITIHELIASGHLVRPRTFVIDIGVSDELKKVKKKVSDFDMNAVAAIMDKTIVNDAVIEHWREKAGDRQTVVFCSTVDHAEHVCAAFEANGIKAVMIHGDLETADRRRRLAQYAKGDFQVIVNVMVLTEGWDHPPTSCVVLLRPSSYKSTYVQMVGRGLRIVDPELHPSIIKTDCIVLDFGRSTLVHGTLEQKPNLRPEKRCPGCELMIPADENPCSNCGHVFVGPEKSEDADPAEGEDPEELSRFLMSEVDLLARSNFRWIDLFDDDHALMATGFTSWGGIFAWNGHWHAVGGQGGEGIKRETRYLGIGERIVAMALADDWLNEHESDDSAHKTRRWLSLGATEKQLVLLGIEDAFGSGMSRYKAACSITFKFNKQHIQRLVMGRSPMSRAA